jgi:hypothetical protein
LAGSAVGLLESLGKYLGEVPIAIIALDRGDRAFCAPGQQVPFMALAVYPTIDYSLAYDISRVIALPRDIFGAVAFRPRDQASSHLEPIMPEGHFFCPHVLTMDPCDPVQFRAPL